MAQFRAEEQYFIWLASVEGMTPARMDRLLEIYEDAGALWDSPAEALKILPPKPARALRDARNQRYLEELLVKVERMPCRLITRLSDEYPEPLRRIYDPPSLLYVRGNSFLAHPQQLAVVGSRQATRDGKRAAREISAGLALHGVCVVSGLARGIDSCAHVGALESAGRTIAVLGCGVDVVYPPENTELVEKILSNGGSLISEYPPGTPPYASHFPARNRIISGLCQGVVIVEGTKKSGAMITVDQALDQGREVFAVPGSIYAPLSEGPNQLIFDGAMPVRSHWDILEHYGWAQLPTTNKTQAAPEGLSDEEQKLVEMLKIEEKSFDELANQTGIPTPTLSSLLTILELRGIISKLPGRIYRA